MSDVTKTPREELECKKKYLYEHSMFWECNDGSKCQILEEDVCDLLNELDKEFEDCGKLLDSKDDFIHKFKRDIEELGISIKLFEDDIATKDKKIDEQQSTIQFLQNEIDELKKDIDIYKYEEKKHSEYARKLYEENEQLRMKLKGDDYIMVSEMLSNLRKTGICDGCKNKNKPVEWYLERGFSITGQICDRYEPE